MNFCLRSWALTLTALATPLAAIAQANAPGAAPGPATPAATSSSQSSAAPAHAAPSAQSEAGDPRASMSPDSAPSSEAQTSAAPPAAAAPGTAAGAAHRTSKRAPPPAPAGKTAADRLELGTATVTGDREQPKVMYIVPWKKSDIGDLSGKPMNSLLDEALAPIDRDEFKRQVMYYQVVKADASQNGASKAPAPQGEK